MKLFYRVLAHLLTGIFVILLGWAIVFYWGIMEEINDEVDDSLEDYSELVIIRSLAGKELPAHDNGSNNQYFLKEVDASYALSKEAICYRDSMIYIAEKAKRSLHVSSRQFSRIRMNDIMNCRYIRLLLRNVI